jgi:hypothetical protein
MCGTESRISLNRDYFRLWLDCLTCGFKCPANQLTKLYKKMKYIIIDKFMPVIFSEGIKHRDLGHGLNVTSAGFCRFDDENQIHAYGESISLNLSSKPEDSEIIQKFLITREY